MRIANKPYHFQIRESIILFLFHHSKNIYRRFFKKHSLAWNTSIEKLSAYQQGTLAYDLAVFLKANNFQLEPKFEKHDIYHIITDYPTTVIGEVCLSLFNVANGKRSVYTIGVAFVGALLLLEEYKAFIAAYQKGKNARSYANWQFEHLLNENTKELKHYIFKRENNLALYI